MSDSEYFRDKVCVVTGGNSGIGYALCEELLKRGAIVYMAGRNPQRVADAASKLSQYQDNIRTVIVDVTHQEQVEKAIKDTAAEAGRLDFLFNNAGVGGTLQFENATMEDWKNIMDLNVWGVIYGVNTAIPIMLKQGFGHIVNTSSIAGIIPMPFQALYSLTKYAITGFTESLKYEYADKGLYFSTVCPSDIATPIYKKSIDGTVHDEVKIPDEAFPPDKAAEFILNRVSQQQGIIIVPEQPNIEFWKSYVLGFQQTEGMLRQLASDRRESFEKKGIYY